MDQTVNRERDILAKLVQILDSQLEMRGFLGVPICNCIDEIILAKRNANRSKRYVDVLEYYLRQFSEGRETQPIDNFTHQEVEAWLCLYSCAYTRQTWLNRLSTLFAFCVRRGHVQFNPCDRVERISIVRRTPRTLTVEQSRATLDFIRKDNPRFIRWYTLAHFLGIRPEETDKTSEPMIEIKNQRVVLPPEIAVARQVPIPAVALEWLKLGGELPLPLSTRAKYIRRVRDFLGFKTWPQDILRHTAASMMLGKHDDIGKVATWLGNSPKMLRTHYIIIPEPERVEAFYNLFP